MITSINQASISKSQSHNEETDWQASKRNNLQDKWHDVSELKKHYDLKIIKETKW